MTMTFRELQLMEPILRALDERGYETPTPIQAQTIPHLRDGRDLLGIAQTGTGKTAAFALPILDFLGADPLELRPGAPSALILTPTRELAAQIEENLAHYGKHLDLKHAVIFGGVNQNPQVRALKKGLDILVATPGRLMDLMQQGHIRLDDIEVFVLDEADRMLDMGFAPAVKRIIAALPKKRQSILFSATMPTEIEGLAKSLLVDPVHIEVTPAATTVERIEQRVMMVEKKEKRDLLVKVLRDPAIERTLVFTRTKRGADRVVKHLTRESENAAAIHGNKSQGQRERALEAFRTGRARVLVATDIAARGIDVQGVTHVINFDLPNEPENYVHRIGRTARAGRDGVAISFCDMEERAYLRDIEKTTRLEIQVVEDHPHRSPTPFERKPLPKAGGAKGKGGGRGPKKAKSEPKPPAPTTSEASAPTDDKPESSGPNKRRRQSRRKPASGAPKAHHGAPGANRPSGGAPKANRPARPAKANGPRGPKQSGPSNDATRKRSRRPQKARRPA